MNALDEAISRAGGPRPFREALGLSPQRLSNWRKRGRVALGQVISVEALTGVSRHRLRPDIYAPTPRREVG